MATLYLFDNEKNKRRCLKPIIDHLNNGPTGGARKFRDGFGDEYDNFERNSTELVAAAQKAFEEPDSVFLIDLHLPDTSYRGAATSLLDWWIEGAELMLVEKRKARCAEIRRLIYGGSWEADYNFAAVILSVCEAQNRPVAIVTTASATLDESGRSYGEFAIVPFPSEPSQTSLVKLAAEHIARICCAPVASK
jgi:hypothetical protein